ncbi:MAG: hypothetical protein J3K34DRAFT_477590 [Monoraphidium minutum]|nr:MAG: hypothetical protein J3K34DRAFT_477590 [Monoraphidium minutum]
MLSLGAAASAYETPAVAADEAARHEQALEACTGGGGALPQGDLHTYGLDALFADGAAPAAAPQRRARRRELAAYALGGAPGAASPGGALLDAGARDAQMELKRGMLQEAGPLLLEAWLESAGLAPAAADRLYRCLYVYSVGFSDALRDALAHSPHRGELLQALWRAYMALSEAALQARAHGAGRGAAEWLSMAGAASSAMGELLFTKEALAEARFESGALAKDVAWLSSAHTEASALRSNLKLQCDELQGGLAKEQRAHQHSVVKYADALEARARMQLDLEEATRQLAASRAAHAEMAARHEAVAARYEELRRQCKGVRGVFRRVDEALSLDTQLCCQLDQGARAAGLPLQPALAAVAAAAAAEQAGEGGGAGGEPAKGSPSQQQTAEAASGSGSDAGAVGGEGAAGGAAEASSQEEAAEDMLPLAERLGGCVELMYGEWRAALDAAARSRAAAFRAADDLRAERQARTSAEELSQQLQSTGEQLSAGLAAAQTEGADLRERLAAAAAAADESRLARQAAECERDHTGSRIAALERRAAGLKEEVLRLKEAALAAAGAWDALQRRLEAAGQRLVYKGRLLAENMKGFCVSLQALWANQTARALLARLLADERRRGRSLGAALEERDIALRDAGATIQDQSEQIVHLRSDGALLDSSLQDAQKQALATSARLQVAESRVDELLAAYSEKEEEAAAGAKALRRAGAKLEAAQGALETARRDIAQLQMRDAAAEADRMLGEVRLEARAAAADAARLEREKRDALDRLDATKARGAARLELQVAKLEGEASAAARRLELAGADLQGERDRCAAIRALLERKRGKKRRWKAACAGADGEVAALQARLLRQQHIEALERRLENLEAELMLLGASARGRVTIKTGGGHPGSGGGDGDDEMGLGGGTQVLDVPEARRLLDDALEESHDAAAEILQLDEQAEGLEASKQALLLSLAVPDLAAADASEVRERVLEARDQIAQIRGARGAAEARRAEAGGRVRAAEAALRAAHEARVAERQQLLAKSALKAEDLVNSAAFAQLAAAEASEAAAISRISEAEALFEAAQRDKGAMGRRMDELQAGVAALQERLRALDGERGALEDRLARANGAVEVSQLKSDRERIRGGAAAAEARAEELLRELEAAKQTLVVTMRGLEAKHDAERAALEARGRGDRARHQEEARALAASAAAARERAGRLQVLLELLAAEALALWQGAAARPPPAAPAGGGGNAGAALAPAAPPLPLPEQAAPPRWLFRYRGGAWRAVECGLRDLALDPSPAALGCARPWVAYAPPPAIPGLSFGAGSLAITISEVLWEKVASDAAADAAGGGGGASPHRPDLEAVVAGFFASRFGARGPADAHVSALAAAVRRHAPRSRRARLFGRLLGLLPGTAPTSPASAAAVVHYVAWLHTECGPQLATEATEGSSKVLCRTAAQLAAPLLRPPLAAPAPEAAALASALRAAAGGSEEGDVDADEACELLLAALEAQRAADAAHLEARAAVRVADPRGQRVSPPAAAALSQEALSRLFAAALRCSGADAQWASPAGAAAALLDAGVVGAAAHQRRHPPVHHRPPYDELLGESWRAVRGPLQDAVSAAQQRGPELAGECAAVALTVRKLEDVLAARAAPGDAWRLYRRLLHGTMLDAAQVVGSGSGSGTPRSARLTTRLSKLGSRAATPRAGVHSTAAALPASLDGGGGGAEHSPRAPAASSPGTIGSGGSGGGARNPWGAGLGGGEEAPEPHQDAAGGGGGAESGGARQELCGVGGSARMVRILRWVFIALFACFGLITSIVVPRVLQRTCKLPPAPIRRLTVREAGSLQTGPLDSLFSWTGGAEPPPEIGLSGGSPGAPPPAAANLLGRFLRNKPALNGACGADNYLWTVTAPEAPGVQPLSLSIPGTGSSEFVSFALHAATGAPQRLTYNVKVLAWSSKTGPGPEASYMITT